MCTRPSRGCSRKTTRAPARRSARCPKCRASCSARPSAPSTSSSPLTCARAGRRTCRSSRRRSSISSWCCSPGTTWPSGPCAASRLLLLFDIDGTLIRERPLAHQRAMIDAIERVYGVEFAPGETPIADVVPHGKTDRQIVREILARRGVDHGAVNAGFEEFERLSSELHHDLEQPLLSGDERERTAALLGRLAGSGH